MSADSADSAGQPINPRDRDLDEILIESSRLMKEGMRLRDEAPAEALDCFNRALDLRRRLPTDEVPVLRYDLAACWLNRAEALLRVGSQATVAGDWGGAALQSYDEALALLRTLPLDDDPRFARRLAIAWQNRGRLLGLLASRAPGGRDTPKAIASFMEAMTVLERHGALVSDRQQLLAAIWMNTANAWMLDAQEQAQQQAHEHRHEHEHGHEHEIAAAQAADAARQAIALVEALEHEDADAAEVGLHARHVLCRALAATTLAAEPATDVASDDVHAATDLADDSLTLVEHWESRGVSRFRALAADFFRFGAQVYAIHQPRFLPEFLQEHLDPARSSQDYVDSPDMQDAAQDTSSLQPVTRYVTLAVYID